MAARKKAGLTAGQVVTLTFGFLLASIIIFVFGLWVGRDLAQQRQERERPVVRARVEGGVPEKGAIIEALPTATVPEKPGAPGSRPTRPRFDTPTKVAAIKVATRTPTRRPPPTRVPATKARPPLKPTVARQARPPASREMWTVQAMATNDQVQALVLARSLRSKGFDAFTSQADVAGATWYRIQVGKFTSKKEAEATAARLRREGLEAPFAERLR